MPVCPAEPESFDYNQHSRTIVETRADESLLSGAIGMRSSRVTRSSVIDCREWSERSVMREHLRWSQVAHLSNWVRISLGRLLDQRGRLLPYSSRIMTSSKTSAIKTVRTDFLTLNSLRLPTIVSLIKAHLFALMSAKCLMLLRLSRDSTCTYRCRGLWSYYSQMEWK